MPKKLVGNLALVYSNAVWILIAILALYYNQYIYAIPAVVIMFVSGLFHYFNYKELDILDTTVSVLYLMLGPYLFVKTEMNTISFVILAIFMLNMVLYLFGKLVLIPKKKYKFFVLTHSLWHISAGVMAFLVYFNYFTHSL